MLTSRAGWEEYGKAQRHALRHPLTVSGAGRTDAGVHAAGQVATIATESDIPANFHLIETMPAFKYDEQVDDFMIGLSSMGIHPDLIIVDTIHREDLSSSVQFRP